MMSLLFSSVARSWLYSLMSTSPGFSALSYDIVAATWGMASSRPATVRSGVGMTM